MTEPFERLKLAREKAGYATAADGARAMGVKEVTYYHHENGTNGLSRSGARYAAFFRVSLDWLLEGRGQMQVANPTIPLIGYVGAGAQVLPINEDRSDHVLEYLDPPKPDRLLALRVRGDSQYPRYHDGEILLVETESRPPASLLNCYAMVDLLDGRRLVKIIGKAQQPERFTLRSHNAPDIENVVVTAAHRVVGCLDV